MNFDYLISTRHRPEPRHLRLNEDVRCDNEVNLILEHHSKDSTENEQSSSRIIIDQYYFMPIREPNSTMILTNADNSTSNNALFEPLTFPSSHSQFYPTMDNDLAALLLSSLQIDEKSDEFLPDATPMGPPPGFENFHFDSTNEKPSTNLMSPHDFSQLLPSTLVEQSIPSESSTDDPMIFFPQSSSSTSQIHSRNTSQTQSLGKASIGSSLSLPTNQTVSPTSLNASPARTKLPIEPDYLFLTNGHSQTSSNSSSSNSIDESSWKLFAYPSTETTITEEVVQENLQLLASIASGMNSVENSWSNGTTFYPDELMKNLNEICDRGFDELNTLIQEQRLLQTHLNMNFSSNSPSAGDNVHCGLARILIIPEYFIFKCQKVERTASRIFEFLAVRRPELRLRDLMFAFQAWKESIVAADLIEREEENKLRLMIDDSSNYSFPQAMFRTEFDRIAYALRQLTNRTQQARAAFQYATSNIFQTPSNTFNRLNSSLASSP